MNATGFQNDFDGPLLVNCPKGQAFYGVQSYHHNGKEDRRFLFSCRTAIPGHFSECHWTGYQNQFDHPIDFQCPHNYLMTGVSSYHSNSKEDRRWKYKCCNAHGYSTKKCIKSGWVNQWDGPMNFRSSKGFITGTTSVHHNGKE